MTTSYLSISEFPGDGVTTEWEFNFAGGYISRDHVLAYIKSDVGVITPYATTSAFISDFKVSVTPAVPIGSTLRVYRDTPREEPIVNFTGGSNFTEANLDLLARQTIFAVAEAFDAGAYAAVNDLLGAAGSALEAALTSQAANAASESNAVASALAAAAALADAIVARNTAVAAAAEPGVAAVLANLTAVQNAATNAATATAKAGEASASAAAASASAVAANGSAVTASAQAVIAALRAADSANSALISAANNEAARSANVIINGRMWNAPDGVTSWTSPTNSVYMLGLWNFTRIGSLTGQLNAAQVSTGPTHCPNALQFTCSTAQTSIAAGDVYASDQVIEANNCKQFIGKTFTVRGSIKSDVAGNVPVNVRNNTGTHAYVFPVPVNAGVETEFEHTIVGGLPAATNWGTGISAGLRFGIGLAVGTTYHSPSPSTWANGVYLGLAGQINAVGAVGRKVAFTNMSLVLGTAKPAADDFSADAARMRYWYQAVRVVWAGYSGGVINNLFTYPITPMRQTPVATISSATGIGAVGTPALFYIDQKYVTGIAVGTGAGSFSADISVALSTRY